ncbi:MAG: ATP-dependent Clp protease ATP-binding subunit ClpA [Pseudomonadota bacterium]
MFSKELEVSLNSIFKQAREKRYEYLTVEHLLLALLEEPSAVAALKACGANLTRLKNELNNFIAATTPLFPATDPNLDIQPTLGFQRVLQRAIFQVQSSGKTQVNGVNILAAIFSEQDSQAIYFLRRENVTRSDLSNYISQEGLPKLENSDAKLSHFVTEEEISIEGPGNSPLELYATNLNNKARLGKVDPLIGRKEELARVIQILCRRRKNNPLLVGEAGVGKTAIVEGLAQSIVKKEVPSVLSRSTIYSLDLGSLLAGTKYRGDFEKRFKALLAQLKQEPQSVLFIDEIHVVIGAGAASGGVMDASNLIKPLLTTGELKCIGATTYQEYRSIFEKDRALARRFQKIDVPEPTLEETIAILRGLQDRLEEHHHVKYRMNALRASVELAARYLPDRFLPDKAIDIVDEAGAYQALRPNHKKKTIIGIHEIEAIVAKMIRIPTRNVSASDKNRLRHLEQKLKCRVFGQDIAIENLCAAMKLTRSGLRETNKTIGSFLFAGPTGVGKTEVTRQLAELMGIELLRFDMSEYMERHSVSRLIGAPPGYIGYDQGGLLTESVTKHPHAVLLLDEIEKAHPDIFNLLLQVMDHGNLTDTNGRKTDFSHIVLVMTSNAGAEHWSRQVIGFSASSEQRENPEAIKRIFSPEFRNRLDATIYFNYLTPEIVSQVVDKDLLELEAQLEKKHVRLHVDNAARLWLAEHGYDKTMGARPMARLIQEKIKKPIADELLFGRLVHGGQLTLTSANDTLQLIIHQKGESIVSLTSPRLFQTPIGQA